MEYRSSIPVVEYIYILYIYIHCIYITIISWKTQVPQGAGAPPAPPPEQHSGLWAALGGGQRHGPCRGAVNFCPNCSTIIIIVTSLLSDLFQYYDYDYCIVFVLLFRFFDMIICPAAVAAATMLLLLLCSPQ